MFQLMGSGGVYHRDIDPYCSSFNLNSRFLYRTSTHMYNICSSSFITGMLQWIRFRLPEQQLLFCTSRSKHQALIRYYTWNHVLTNLLISPGIFAWAQQSYILSMVDWIGKAAASHIFPTQLGILRATHTGVKQRWYLNPEQKTLHTSPETHQIILKIPAQALSKSG